MQGIIKTFKTDSQNQKILEYLQLGNTLTCLDSVRLGLSHNLRSRISDIIRAGHNIKIEHKKVNGTYISVYSLMEVVKNGL